MSIRSQKKVAFGIIILTLLLSLLYIVQKYRTVTLVEPYVGKSTEDTPLYVVEGSRLLQDIETQLSFGPRYLGSEGHGKVIDWIREGFPAHLFTVTSQQWVYVQGDGAELTFVNVVSRFAPEKVSRIILGAHFDSRAHADQDSVFRDTPVPGANDSASGVAVLREVARAIEQAEVKPRIGVDFVFFDAEEGDPTLPHTEKPWSPIGSEYFARHVSDYYGESLPQAALVVDMVCDADLEISIEAHSYRDARSNTEHIWSLGHSMYPEVFKNSVGTSIFDDHSSLNAVGIPSTLLIDFTYPYWHTTNDTLDKCSVESLRKVTEVVLAYVYSF